MDFKIKLPEIKVNEIERENLIKSTLTDDFDKRDGYLSKTLVFIYMNKPSLRAMSVTEIKESLENYYKKEIERIAIFRAVERLAKLGLLHKVVVGDLLTMEEEHLEEIHHWIIARHKKAMSKMPPQFRHRYNSTNYVWIANGEGLKYLEWACRLNNFQIQR